MTCSNRYFRLLVFHNSLQFAINEIPSVVAKVGRCVVIYGLLASRQTVETLYLRHLVTFRPLVLAVLATVIITSTSKTYLYQTVWTRS